ncbi:Scr1 family TA system antitoxin-like transcriptional regulator [Pseudonocardia sp. HH130630-07]|uniref:Scr1 family TA system antitoxin-like transcriptional regulator n=1 Tax=Pseudonocardia sp. HH130630-07 TaxID=1690815 RepID=UPI001E43555E|nr:Scr1 family TA system antitoxin-like transcriptional regulator [Pseudonocardia sp. HH130630-07]
MDFPQAPHGGEVLEPPLVYAETLTGAMYLNKPEEVAAYHLVWNDLQSRALDEDRTRDRLTVAREELGNE